MKNLDCLICKCNTCQDDYCKLESCSEECRENKVIPHLGDCSGYCAVPVQLVPNLQVNTSTVVPFRKILVVNGQFYAGVGKEFSAKRSEAVVFERQGDLISILVGVFSSVIDGVTELKRIEVLKA